MLKWIFRFIIDKCMNKTTKTFTQPRCLFRRIKQILLKSKYIMCYPISCVCCRVCFFFSYFFNSRLETELLRYENLGGILLRTLSFDFFKQIVISVMQKLNLLLVMRAVLFTFTTFHSCNFSHQ